MVYYELLSSAWHLSDSGWMTVTANFEILSKNIILRNALNSDLKNIGAPSLPANLTNGTLDNVVLQVQKLRNISAPKSNSDSHVAPRMLKFVLSDGEKCIHGIEIGHIKSITVENTAPGTKLLLTKVHMRCGYLLLNGKNTENLGGQVSIMMEKWESSKKLEFSKNRQSRDTVGPPKWINFKSQPEETPKNKLNLTNINMQTKPERIQLTSPPRCAINETQNTSKVGSSSSTHLNQRNLITNDSSQKGNESRSNTHRQERKQDIPQRTSRPQKIYEKRFNMGEFCLAKYWEDDKFYPAKIQGITTNTYVVIFQGYGNVEEVNKVDCKEYTGDKR